MEIVSSFIRPLISSFIQPLMSCIGPPVIQQFGYLKAKEKVDELIRRAGDVEAKKKDIQDHIGAASREGKQCTNEVRRWIQKVEGLGGEVTIVQSDYDHRGRCWPNCWSCYKIGRRASKLLIKLTDLEKERADFNALSIDAPPAPVQQMSSTSNVVGNMIISNKEKICRYLKEETDEVIGIWGMGGVGKTTLLEAINDNFLNNNNGNSVTNKLFDHVIFIVVSKEYKLENLQKMIIEKLGLRSSEDLVSQAQIISEYLKEKSFLLLLDDIWKVVQLKDLGIPYPHSSSERRFRCKVVFTTRSLQVCAGMKCHKKIKVDCLEADEAWDLFKKNVGEDINLSDIRSHAKEVIKECGGLPLALVVIGRAMATKKSPQEWDYALTQLRNSQHSNIPGMEMEEYYFLRLKFSYDNLRDDKMRECFLCCSLWPEDYEITKNELIMCWMGLGLIDGFEDIKEAYDEGYSLIGSLIVASLLQPVPDKDDVIKLHDVLRDLALWIACESGTNKNRWLVKAGVGLEEVRSEVVAKWGVAERVSLMRNAIKELPTHLPPCPNLSTLFLQRNKLKLTGIPEDFFTCMSNLTYLDLSNTHIQDIPNEICYLDKLRYLNLSYTSISSLPEKLGQLINLKYLLVRDTHIGGEVIRGIIGRLLELKYLDLYPDGFVETDELLRLPLLKGVGMKITSEHALQQLSRVPILHLTIEDMGDSTTTSIHLHHLLSSGTKLSLRELRFTKCHSIRDLVVDADVRLPRLETLRLDRLENLTKIVWRSVLPPSECFQRLRHLSIYQCYGLKDITWVLHLPCLEELNLSGCNEMEQLVVIGGGEVGALAKPTFPRLRWLTLRGLDKLAMICDNHAAVNFPSLETLYVWNCNELKDITWVLHLPCLKNLTLSDCYEMEQLVVIGGGEEVALEERGKVTKPTFPRLRWLVLFYLPKLAMICDNHDAAVNFPSLEVLLVEGCEELKKLPFHPQLLNNNYCSRLKEIRGRREWWEGIEWEDQSAKSSLQPYFVDEG